jgi:hypothetical protein
MDFREIGWEVVDWIHADLSRVLWRALVYTIMNLQVP